MATLLADFHTAHSGIIHDAQLDEFGQCLATASDDGHVRLWCVRRAEEPLFLADLDGHAAAVQQVAWAPATSAGVLLASCSSDGTVVIWGRGAKGQHHWEEVHREPLQEHGAVLAVAWAPPDHGAVLACASSNGTVAVVRHLCAVRSGDTAVEHRWCARTVGTHKTEATSVSWGPPPALSDRPMGLAGARLASAGADGMKVWHYEEVGDIWVEGAVDPIARESSEATSGGGAAGRGQLAARDVAWKPWDGISDVIASATANTVHIWTASPGDQCTGLPGRTRPVRWTVCWRVALREAIWRLSWATSGGVLMVSFGEEEERAALLKQRLDGEWDLVEVGFPER